MAWVALLVFGAVWLYAAWQAGLTRGFFRDARESTLVFWSIRLLVLSSLAGLGVGLLWPSAVAAFCWPVSPALALAGLLLALAGSALFAWVTVALGRHFSTSLHLREGHRLVTAGPYRWVRHPMYLAYQLAWLGFLLVTGNGFAILGIMAFVLAMAVRVGREEAMMAEAFGEDWQAYCRRTGRFIPRCR